MGTWMAESFPEELLAKVPLMASFLRNNPFLGWIIQDWIVGVTSSLPHEIVHTGELG